LLGVCEGASHKARTACDIEHGVVRPRRGSFDDQPQHRLSLIIAAALNGAAWRVN
jgi:hypothetical protein